MKSAKSVAPRRTGRSSIPPQRRAWEAFISHNKEPQGRFFDDAWKQFKATHAFDPKAFEHQPPWCIEGAENNPWATKAFLGDARREAAWALLGYCDNPFDFAYLWLDYAGFNGLRPPFALPLVVRKTRGELKREATRLEAQCRRLSHSLAAWPFRGDVQLERLLQDSDFLRASTVRIFGRASSFSDRERHVGAQFILAGARPEIPFALGGKGSLLDRAADVLRNWEPPASLVDRPKRKGLKSRYAIRWLDEGLRKMGGEIPLASKCVLIAELLQILRELGQWEGEETWTPEQVRRCLDGKSEKKKRDSV